MRPKSLTSASNSPYDEVMTGPEIPGGSHNFFSLEKLKEFFQKLFFQKKLQEEAEKASHVRHERESYETSERREKEKRRREIEDRGRKYHEAQSFDAAEKTAEAVRNIRAGKVEQLLTQVVNSPQLRPNGSDYLFNVIQTNTDLKDALDYLINHSPSSAEVVYKLAHEGAELHGNALELIKLAQRLSYEASNLPSSLSIQEVLQAVSGRVQKLLKDEFHVSQREARRQGLQGPRNAMELLEQDEGIVMTDDEKNHLGKVTSEDDNQTWSDWNNTINDVITKERAPVNDHSRWVKESATPPSTVVIDKIVAPIDEIWGEIERREATSKLTVDDLKKYERSLMEESAKILPKDAPPGSDSFNNQARSIDAYMEEKMNKLAATLKERLRSEKPVVREGIVKVEDFLKEMVLHKGRLGDLFARNPEMQILFYGHKTESTKFRNKVFLKIHSAVLSDRRNSSDQNFGLYERADFTSFIDLLKIGLSKLYVRETGDPLGQAWADYYNNLSNTIRQSRDLDFWATQPGTNIEHFSKSLALFQNEYTYHAMSIPAVNAAFRAYETTLRSIQDSNDGYIPPALIEYSAPNTGAFWDQWSQSMLKQMITMGAVPDIERDPLTGFQVIDEDGHSVKLSKTPLDTESFEDNNDELLMYMTLAKGVGLVSARYLEIFANSKIPGSDHPEKGMEGFHSNAYEGVARALNYTGMVINKWKFGSYRYFYFMNMLLPTDKRIPLDEAGGRIDSREAMKVFMAYQDGTFEQKYGKEAKRFLDSTNFSGISSAIGRDTLWRQFDSTINWSDRERERLGGPTRIALSEKYADEMIKDQLVVGEFREEYRQSLIAQNSHNPSLNLATSGAGFDKLWKEYGKSKYSTQIDRKWDELQGKSPKKGRMHKPYHEYKQLREAFQKAFKARVWVEMAMRNPLVVAHNLKIDIPAVGSDTSKKIKLHNLLVQEILSIPPEDTKYGEMFGKSASGVTPTLTQRKYMIEVLQLEGDLAAVKEKAMQKARDLTDADFEIIKDDVRRGNALLYWRRVKEVILGSGSDDPGLAGKYYKDFGLQVSENGEDYAWDYHKIHEIEETLKGLESQHESGVAFLTGRDGQTIKLPFLLKQAVETKWEWILGTDDMDFGRMDWLNLGSRQWVRRGGDIAAHWAGSEKMAQYFTNIVPNPDKQQLAKTLKEIRQAYEGDTIEAGWSVVGNLAYLTSKLYSWDWGIMGSIAQKEIFKTRRNVAAWNANARREFWDALEHEDVLPPHGHFYYYPIDEKINIHQLRNDNHAGDIDVWTEILTLGILLAVLITIYKGLTAKDESEEGGSGGGGGHH